MPLARSEQHQIAAITWTHKEELLVALASFCPNLDPTNLTTYPEYCPPLPECGLDRLQGSACDMPQGDFEPELCHKGHYCPTSALMLECPSRHFCVAGTVSPHKCDFSSYCPAGSETPFKFGGLINLFVASIVVAVAIVAHRRFFCEYQLTFEDCSLAASPNTEGRSMMRVSVGGPKQHLGQVWTHRDSVPWV